MDHIIKYRKDIDGLRALSVLIVIFFHYGLPGFAGGFVGVDIFFVISGYLISSIIIKELNENKFSFLKFYERRIRRIFPALFFIIIVTTVFGYFLFDFISFRDLGRTIAATSVFGSNAYFYLKVNDYFAAPNNPLLHTWSLAVEEQFYILYPASLFLIYKFQKRYVNYYLVIAALASFIFCVIKVNHNQPLSFYSPATRAWEPLAGVLLSVSLYPAIKNKTLNQVLALTGLGLILIALFAVSNITTYPSYNTLLPIAGASLLIYTGKNGSTVVSKLLSLNPVVFIGKISYSLYLWHWVLLIALKTVRVEAISPVEVVLLTILTFLLSYLSWRFIEQPFRNKQIFANRNKLFAAAAVVSIAIFGFGYYVHKTSGMRGRHTQSKLMLEIEKKENGWQALNKADKKTAKLTPQKDLFRIGNTKLDPQYLLWGDSHAKALVAGFDSAAKAKNVGIYFATGAGTPPLLGARRLNHKPDGAIIAKKVLTFLSTHPNIKTVFLAARWNYYENNNDQGMILEDDSVKKTGVHDNRRVFENGLIATVKAIRAMGKNVIVITDVPAMDAMPIVYINERKLFYPKKQLNDLTPDTGAYYKLNVNALNLFNRLQKDSLIEVLPVYEKFFANNRFILEENHHLLYRDEQHLSYYGSTKLARVLSGAIK